MKLKGIPAAGKKIKCPQCSKAFAPVAANDGRPQATPTKVIACPGCKKNLKIAVASGKAVKCPRCEMVFRPSPPSPAKAVVKVAAVVGPEPRPAATPMAKEVKPSPPPVNVAPPPAPPNKPRPARKNVEPDTQSRSGTLVAALFILLAITGAGYWFFFRDTTTVVRGTVTYKGAPLPSGTIGFIPANGVVLQANIQDGKYELRKIPAGDTVVVVEREHENMKNKPKMSPEEWTKFAAEWEPKGFNVLPPRYISPQLTPLKFKVEVGANRFDIQIDD